MAAPAGDPASPEQPIAMATVTSATGLCAEVRAGRHHFVVDEGPAVGGQDEGPNPFQLILAGLAQCTAATLRLYADRKGWDLGEIGVRARLVRTGDGATKVERIDRTVTVTADLSAAQTERLAEIADRTPVTGTLIKGLTIDTTVARHR
jgi:putative redox protein